MQTTFAKWLAARGEAHSAYAIRRGINKDGVARLAGVGHRITIRYFNMSFLETVSADTGIPIATLIEDATKAAANPTPPRRYNRKGTGNGKGQ